MLRIPHPSRPRPVLARVAATAALLAASAAAVPATAPELPAQDPQVGGARGVYTPPVKEIDAAGLKAIDGIRIPQDFTIRRLAAEPALANPVAFTIDHQGRIYVVETFRLKKGVFDNRDHMAWLDRDLAARTVEDRLAIYRDYFGDQVSVWETDHERIRLLEDRDGDDVAERSVVYADGFSELADGIAAGVLAREGDVYFTCIPKLWRLRDNDGDGRADERETLSEGYGVHTSLLGHDLHGLCIGLDGRLYFSIGDRGYNVTTAEGDRLVGPDEGAVFRCEFDGSGLEVYATGLRNPQELAFDDHGNLFTGDNNGDGGDRARFVYVMQGADIGWRIGFQWLPDRGPWNDERLWHTWHRDQPAFVLPPLAHIGSGPSGLAYNPGTGLPARYDDCFFLCDFRGQPRGSGVHAVRVQPDGAGFQVDRHEWFVSNVLVTDCAFGVDGGLVVSDWVMGWDQTMRGRLYRVTRELGGERAQDVRATRALLANGFDHRSVDELTGLLGHVDRRVRLEAQLELVGRGAEAVAPLVRIAREALDDPLARIHALRGLGIALRKGFGGDTARSMVRDLLADPAAELRAQAATVVGEVAARPPMRDDRAVADRLFGIARDDDNARARAQACLALGHLGTAGAFTGGDRVAAAREALVEVLAENADTDPFLRHAAVCGLEGLGRGSADGRAAVLELTAHADASVRLGLAVALRRLHAPEVALLLSDDEARVVRAAVRAIYDEPILAAMPALAQLVDRPFEDGVDAVAMRRRALHANRHVGTAAAAEAVGRSAARAGTPEAVRREALEILAAWTVGASQDGVVGDWRVLPAEAPRSAEHASAALARVVPGLLGDAAPDGLRLAAARAARAILPRDGSAATAALGRIVRDGKQPDDLRGAALDALAGGLAPGAAVELARTVGNDEGASARRSALRILADAEPAAAIERLRPALSDGNARRRRDAIQVLSGMPGESADALLTAQIEQFAEGRFPAGASLELMEAAEARGSEAVQEALLQVTMQRDPTDLLASYEVCLEGGDRNRGRRIFHYEPAASCLRCHQVGPYGGEAGPPLDGIGSKRAPRELLESMLMPAARIAEGYEQVVLGTRDGATVIGTLKEETDTEIALVNDAGLTLRVAKADVTSRTSGGSAMPALAMNLPKRDIRDLIAYLRSLRDPRIEREKREQAKRRQQEKAAEGHGGG